MGRVVHDFLVRIHPSQHRAGMARPALATPEHCATCHTQFMDADMNGWGWVKMQDEYAAWVASRYLGRGDPPFATETVVRCQDCHFPLIRGSDPSASASGLIRSHRTPGANTAIPWFNGDQLQLETTREFLRSGKLLLSIDRPWRHDPVRTGEFVAEKLRSSTEAPFIAYLGDELRLTVSVTNVGVGHDFPGGTTDINEAWLAVRVADAENRTIFESGEIDEHDAVDPAAHFYRSVTVDRHGNHVWRHDLFNMVGDAYRKTIPAGATDVVHYTLTVPYWTKGPLTVSAVLRYRKLNIRYARWALDDATIELPIIDLARDVLQISVQDRPAVQLRMPVFGQPARALEQDGTRREARENEPKR